MRAILDVAIPFFALIFLGFAALRWSVLDRSAVNGLNAFVYWFALPVLLFDKVAASPIGAIADPDFFIAYYGAGLPVYALGLGLGLTVFGAGLGRAALMGLAASFGNVGYMGIPLLLTALGPEHALPAVLAVTFDNLTTVFVTIVLLEVSARGRGGAGAILGVLRGLAANPLIWATLLGGAVAAMPFDLPATVSGFNRLLGGAAAPCALFALGGALNGTRIKEGLGEVLTLAALKLFVQPALLALIVLHLWPIPPETGVPVLILTALPTAATVFVLAERYGVGVPGASGMVLFTHLVSVATLTGLLVWLTPG